MVVGARAGHLATRHHAGLFDFSFMALHEFSDAGALEPLQSRDLARLAPGRIAYTLLLDEGCTVFNDATVWRLPDGRWWLFSGRRSDGEWIRARAAGARDRSGDHAVIALQGPASGAILAAVAGEAFARALRYFDFAAFPAGGPGAWIGRIGYSGELGYEIVAAARDGDALRGRLLEAGRAHGLEACGFDAADSLRIECGYVLFDREIRGVERPGELGLERLVERGARRPQEPPRKLVGFAIDPGPARSRPWLPAARVTSEADSPVFGQRLALGFVGSAHRHPGTLVRLQDDRLARVARLPFYDPLRRRPRATPL